MNTSPTASNRWMFRSAVRQLAFLSSVAWAAACGDGTEPANQAPTTVGTIAAQEIYAGESATLDASQYFSDPDGDALTYQASSSDAAAVEASVSDSTVTVRAVGRGSATVTVTASDPDGLSATQSFAVTVPNKPPRATGDIPPQEINLGGSRDLDVFDYFEDEDGDALSYEASSADEGIATVSTSGSVVTVTATAETSAVTTVTVTASDPDGESATRSFEARAVGFQDEFASAGSLSDWEFSSLDASISRGRLRLSRNDPDFYGLALHVFGAPLDSDWEVTVRLASETGDATPDLLVGTGDSRFEAYRFNVAERTVEGESYNYYLFVYDAEGSQGAGWYWVFRGNSSSIDTGPGEFTEIKLSIKDGIVSAYAGGDELYSDEILEGLPTRFEEVGLSAWYGEVNDVTFYDWVRVRSVADGASSPPAMAFRPRSSSGSRLLRLARIHPSLGRNEFGRIKSTR